MCTFFALQAGGFIEKLKLIKLVYLCERQHLAEYEDAMLFDELYSLPHGPVCSSTLNAVNKTIHSDLWDKYVVLHGNLVGAVKTLERDEFDELSDIDLDIARNVWSQFKDMTSSQIRNYTHANCPEYTEIEDGRIPISYREVLEALGSEHAAQIDSQINYLRKVEGELV